MDMVVHAYNPNHLRGKDRNSRLVQAQKKKKVAETLFQKLSHLQFLKSE
jgi:hypothetical protein